MSIHNSAGESIVVRPRTSNDFIAATIFWLYILGALSFTAVAIQTIVKLPSRSRKATGGQQQLARVLSIAATISFAALSFNMLNILIQSCVTWSSTSRTDWSIRNKWLSNIWTWSLETKPFVKFIEDITSSPEVCCWSTVALIATFDLHVYMGVEGKRRNIPNLWAFFGLAQILPISFASSLFFLALLRSSAPEAIVELPTLAWVLPGAAFYILLGLAGLGTLPKTYSLAQGAGQQSWIVPLVVLARMMLLVPPLVVKRVRSPGSRRSQSTKRPVQLAQELVLLATIYLAVALFSGGLQTSWRSCFGLFTNPAVSTLGCDFISLIIITQIWAAYVP